MSGDRTMLEEEFNGVLGTKIKNIESIRSDLELGPIRLPGVIIVGDAQVGKTSILEGLTGILLPKDCSTRTPTVLSLESHPHIAETSIRISQKADDLNGTYCGSPAELEGYYRSMARGARESDKPIRNEPIYIRYARRSGPEFTIVDLPGVSEAITDHPNFPVREITTQIVEEYFKKDTMIVLFVHPAATDIGNASSLKVVEENDKDGSRTILVLAKCDHLREEANKDFLGKLRKICSQSLDLFKKNGFVVLRNRLPGEEHRTMEELEKESFSNDVLRGLRVDERGFKALIRKIVMLQSELVCAEHLSDTKSAVRDRIWAVEKNLEELRSLEIRDEQHGYVIRTTGSDSEKVNDRSGAEKQDNVEVEEKKSSSLSWRERAKQAAKVYKTDMKEIMRILSEAVGVKTEMPARMGPEPSDRTSDTDQGESHFLGESEALRSERGKLVKQLETLKTSLERLENISSEYSD